MPPYLPLFLREAVDFYDKVKTQWRVVSGMAGGGYVGLDYIAVCRTAEIYGFELDDFKMDVLREIENFMIGRSYGQ